MEEPRSELRADADEHTDAPNFDALASPETLVEGDRTRDDFLDAVLGLDSPATTNEVAELAGHGVDAAREYLEWFERMGIVTRVTESPATYQRNEAYLDWRRVQSLRSNYATADLLEFLQAASDRVETLAAEFDADSPDDVSLSQHADATDRSVDEVWERLAMWRTARRQVSLLERALSAGSGDTADRQSAV